MTRSGTGHHNRPMDRRREAPPPWDSWKSAVDEVAPWRGASPQAHYRGLYEACALAFAILDSRPDRDAMLSYQDPLPPEAVETLRRLRKRRGR